MAANLGNWQAALEDILQNAKGLEEFRKLTTYEDKIKFIQDKDYLMTSCTDHAELFKSVDWLPFYLENCDKIHLKSAQKSKQFREQGNKYFQNKSFEEAFDLYTRAVLTAPVDTHSPELSLGYGNRSAALFFLGRYKSCLGDIEAAVLSGYPEHLSHKVYLRKAQCHCRLGNTREAEGSLQKAREFVSKNSELDQKKKITFLQDVMNCAKNLSGAEERSACKSSSDQSNGVGPVVSVAGNSVITQATSSLTMEYTTEKGRHLLATEFIPAGSTLIVERPYTAVLLPDHYNTHCHHCFGLLISVVPCYRCSQVQYCSEKCRDKSWSSYHCVECRYLDLLHSVGIAHLSLRVILVAGLSYLTGFQDEYQQLCAGERVGGLTKEGRYERNYLSVYDLLTHRDKMQTEDLFQYTLTGTLLLKILKSAGWFSQVPIATKERIKSHDIELYVGGLLVRHILQLVCNAHAITELQVSQASDETLVETKSQVRVATAIYPTASLMNHSCDPTIISSFDRDLLVVRAVKDVPKGGEIFNCYGPHHKRMNRSERRTILKEQYMFDCNCEACQREQTADLIFSAYKCPRCSSSLQNEGEFVTCVCGLHDRIDTYRDRSDNAHQVFLKALQKLEDHNISDAIDLLLECYNMQRQVLYKFHRSLAETQDCLAKCYSMTGNFQISSVYLKDSIETVKELYGDKSIEYANELHKFAEVLCSAGKTNAALEVTKQSLTLLQMHYGSNHPTVTELEELSLNLQMLLNRI